MNYEVVENTSTFCGSMFTPIKSGFDIHYSKPPPPPVACPMQAGGQVWRW
ncbi:MAG: hypothetical protein KKF20_03135 [Bacteroidetes bacterium]|nr:hypothetical protein [Bacteroidota bacterium]MBU2471384.1 hypothetical protein [Bacteroidota bacterium]MBU2635997.1 hypothetical protein [Bacteroidota bacterium]